MLRLRSPDGELFDILVGRRVAGSNLERGLTPVNGERFETWITQRNEVVHVVVRTEHHDLDVMGRAPTELALDVLRSVRPWMGDV